MHRNDMIFLGNISDMFEEEEEAEEAGIDDELLGELDDDAVVDDELLAEELDPLLKENSLVALDEDGAEGGKDDEGKVFEDDEEDVDDYDSFDDEDEL